MTATVFSWELDSQRRTSSDKILRCRIVAASQSSSKVARTDVEVLVTHDVGGVIFSLVLLEDQGGMVPCLGLGCARLARAAG